MKISMVEEASETTDKRIAKELFDMPDSAERVRTAAVFLSVVSASSAWDFQDDQ